MKNEIVKIGDNEFTVYTEKNTTVCVDKPLYELITLDEYGYFTRSETFFISSSFRLLSVLEQIKNDGLEEYVGITNSDLELLENCIKLFENKQVDRIIFELSL